MLTALSFHLSKSEHLCGHCWSTWGGTSVQVLCGWPVDPWPSWGRHLFSHSNMTFFFFIPYLPYYVIYKHDCFWKNTVTYVWMNSMNLTMVQLLFTKGVCFVKCLFNKAVVIFIKFVCLLLVHIFFFFSCGFDCLMFPHSQL